VSARYFGRTRGCAPTRVVRGGWGEGQGSCYPGGTGFQPVGAPPPSQTFFPRRDARRFPARVLCLFLPRSQALLGNGELGVQAELGLQMSFPGATWERATHIPRTTQNHENQCRVRLTHHCLIKTLLARKTRPTGTFFISFLSFAGERHFPPKLCLGTSGKNSTPGNLRENQGLIDGLPVLQNDLQHVDQIFCG
jgi:hypothetical protein